MSMRRYAVVAAVALLAACADSGSEERVDTPLPVSTVVTDAQVLATGTEFAQCLSDHGVRDVPPPTVQSGRLVWTAALSDSPARRVCQHIIDPMPAERLWPAETPAVGSDGDPVRSAGCGRPAPAGAGTSTRQTVDSAGVNRLYLLHLPRGYSADAAVPVVLALHGGTSQPAPNVMEEMEQETRFSELADRDGFVVVYPRSATTSGGTTGWNIGGKENPTVDDVRFIDDLLDRLDETLCVDRRRIYATGFSSGGGMTNVLACRSAGRIAAFAPVSGAFFVTPGACQPSRPVPILEFHGTSDKVPYEGGPFGPDTLLAVPRWLQDWADRNHCTRGPTAFFTMVDIAAEHWSRCVDPSTVIGYRILNGRHLWPGVDGSTRTIDATTLIWRFFRNHQLP